MVITIYDEGSSSPLLNVKWILLLIASVVYSITQFPVVMYLAMAVLLCSLIPIKTRFSDEQIFTDGIDLLIAALMMPDNYCIILAIIYFTIRIGCRQITHRSVFAVAALAAYCAFNVILRSVPLNNIVLYCVYSLPFILIYGSCSKVLSGNRAYRYLYILSSLKRLTLIEFVSVVAYAITHLSVIASYNDMDWVVGTFGTFQANTLMVVEAFSFLIFLSAIKRGVRGCVPWCAAAAILMVSTSSVSFLVVFALAFMAVIFFSSSFRLSERIAIAALSIGVIFVFISVSPDWITRELVKMTDSGYAYSRFEKAKYFERTFLEIPTNEGTSYFLFGTGLGTYSSRAAMTCAGDYIDMYDRAFQPYNSRFRTKYLGDQDRKKGLASMADSSVVSIQGELGFIGLVALVAFVLIAISKSRNPYYRMSVLFFVGLLFMDNALEYAKYYSIFCLACACARAGIAESGLAVVSDCKDGQLGVQ